MNSTEFRSNIRLFETDTTVSTKFKQITLHSLPSRLRQLCGQYSQWQRWNLIALLSCVAVSINYLI